jgi:four helix bundle protein
MVQFPRHGKSGKDIHTWQYGKRRGLSEKLQFLNFAQGSLEECRYYLILIQDLRYAVTADLASLLEEVSKLFGAYATAIEAKRWALKNL